MDPIHVLNVLFVPAWRHLHVHLDFASQFSAYTTIVPSLDYLRCAQVITRRHYQMQIASLLLYECISCI